MAHKYIAVVLKFSVPLKTYIMKGLRIWYGYLYQSDTARFCCPCASKFLPHFASNFSGNQIMYSALLPHLHLHLNPFIQRVLFINFQFLHEGNLDTLLQVWPDFEAKP